MSKKHLKKIIVITAGLVLVLGMGSVVYKADTTEVLPKEKEVEAVSDGAAEDVTQMITQTVTQVAVEVRTEEKVVTEEVVKIEEIEETEKIEAVEEVEEVEEKVSAEMTKYVEQYISMELVTDKEVYYPGENIRFTLQTTNTGGTSVPVVAKATDIRLYDCISMRLLKNWKEESEVWYGTQLISEGDGVQSEAYWSQLNPNAVLKNGGECKLSASSGDLSQKDEYVMEITFAYRLDQGENAELKYYTQYFSIRVESIPDCETLVNNYLDVQCTTDKESYNPGEEVNVKITTTNTSSFPIYRYDSSMHEKNTGSRCGLYYPDRTYVPQDFGGIGIGFCMEDHTLMPAGETVEFNYKFKIPEELTYVIKEDNEPSFYIEFKFIYGDTMHSDMNRRELVKTFPVTVHLSQTEDVLIRGNLNYKNS